MSYNKLPYCTLQGFNVASGQTSGYMDQITHKMLYQKVLSFQEIREYLNKWKLFNISDELDNYLNHSLGIKYLTLIWGYFLIDYKDKELRTLVACSIENLYIT